jgi:hypothetical protein
VVAIRRALDCCDCSSFAFVRTGAEEGVGSNMIGWNMRSWASMGADADEYTLTESIELDLRNDAPRRISSVTFREKELVFWAGTPAAILAIVSFCHLSPYPLGSFGKPNGLGEGGYG